MTDNQTLSYWRNVLYCSADTDDRRTARLFILDVLDRRANEPNGPFSKCR